MELFFQYHIGISLFLNPRTIRGFSLYKKRTRRGALSVLLIFRSDQCVNRKVNRNTTVRIAVTMLMSLILPVQSLMSVYEMNPAAIP